MLHKRLHGRMDCGVERVLGETKTGENTWRDRLLSMRVVIDKQIRNNVLVIGLGAGIQSRVLLSCKTKNSNGTQNLIAVMRCSAAILLTESVDMGAISGGYTYDYVPIQDGSYVVRPSMAKSAGINNSQNSWAIAMLL